MIDRDDAKELNYLVVDYYKRCQFTSCIGAIASLTGYYSTLRHGVGIGKGVFIIFLGFLPIFSPLAAHYYYFSRFLDYCIDKYEDQGLWDDEL